MSQQITLPYKYRLRPYQESLWGFLEGGGRYAAEVWHRRAGKDLFTINWLACQAMQRVGLYWHVLPTYRQGRKVVWEGRTKEGVRFLDAFGPGAPQPGPLIERSRDDEMTLWLRNGSMFQVVGADEPDRLVGANPLGAGFSEYSVMNPQAWEYIRPILMENGGFAIFIFTPRGRNHGWKLLQMARQNPDWHAQVLTVDDTGAVSPEEIEAARRSGMSDEMIQQEFRCSFDAPLVGSYFGDQMTEAFNSGRICPVSHDPSLPVDTGWDIGVSDSTVIWFAQRAAGQVRLIDLAWGAGQGADYYAREIHRRDYVYGDHFLPHDVKQRQFGQTGAKTILEALRRLNVRGRVVPRVSIPDRINAARMLLPRCVFDEKACEIGIEALKQYRKQQLDGVLDPEGKPVFRDTPVHDWTSHYADAFCSLAVGMRTPITRDEGSPPPRAPMAIV